jgi:hypothetical protein
VSFVNDSRQWEDSEAIRWIGQYIDVSDRVALELDVPAVTYRGSRLDVIHPDDEGYQWRVADLIDVLDERGMLPPAPAR